MVVERGWVGFAVVRLWLMLPFPGLSQIAACLEGGLSPIEFLPPFPSPRLHSLLLTKPSLPSVSQSTSRNKYNMGLFSRNSTRRTQQYAPPPGPPPSAQHYGGAYTPSSSAQPHHQQQAYAPPQGAPPGYQEQQNHLRPAHGGDPLEQLAHYDTAFLIDDSESMEMWWDDTAKALAAIVDIAASRDPDGVDVSFLNSTVKTTSRNASEIMQLFRRVEPRKSTPTATALKRVLEPYMDNYHNWVIEGKPSGYPPPRPLNLIVLTDGAPNRGENPEAVIVEVAQRLDRLGAPPLQVGIQFVQIGNDDEAAAHLQELDDDLKTKHGSVGAGTLLEIPTATS